MNALIVTAPQAAALRAANNNPNLQNRRIEPRLLEDGTLILNADILTDPIFNDATKPWRSTLNQITRPKVGDKTLEQFDRDDVAAREEFAVGQLQDL